MTQPCQTVWIQIDGRWGGGSYEIIVIVCYTRLFSFILIFIFIIIRIGDGMDPIGVDSVEDQAE